MLEKLTQRIDDAVERTHEIFKWINEKRQLINDTNIGCRINNSARGLRFEDLSLKLGEKAKETFENAVETGFLMFYRRVNPPFAECLAFRFEFFKKIFKDEMREPNYSETSLLWQKFYFVGFVGNNIIRYKRLTLEEALERRKTPPLSMYIVQGNYPLDLRLENESIRHSDGIQPFYSSGRNVTEGRSEYIH